MIIIKSLTALLEDSRAVLLIVLNSAAAEHEPCPLLSGKAPLALAFEVLYWFRGNQVFPSFLKTDVRRKKQFHVLMIVTLLLLWARIRIKEIENIVLVLSV